jgi:hypothetical protein
MPIPKPHDGENHDNFIDRCMGNDRMVREYERNDQRFAICQSSWERKHESLSSMLSYNKPMATMNTKDFLAHLDEAAKFEPEANIRRYDVFAVYNYVKNKNNGISDGQAKGDAIWLATVVAARKFRKSTFQPRPGAEPKQAKRAGVYTGKWRELSGIPQTDKLYDKKIVERMGESFYKSVFLPAVKREVDAGHDYTDFRDTLRARFNK